MPAYPLFLFTFYPIYLLFKFGTKISPFRSSMQKSNQDIIIMRKFIKILLIFLSVIPLSAQDIGILPILTSSPSPKLNAIGGVGVALPTSDAYGQFYNPAQVGYAARSSNFTIHLLPGGQNLSNEPKPELRSSAVNLGYQLRARGNRNSEGGISVGVGYINSDLNLGESVFRDEDGNVIQTAVHNEDYYSISLGVGFEYYLIFHLGLGYKWIKSSPGLVQISETQFAAAVDNLGAWDYGIMITAPLHRFIFGRSEERTLRPLLDFTIGYSRTNVADEVKYHPSVPGLPVPRTARLGYSVRGGMGITYDRKPFQAFEAFFSVEANDILVELNENSFSYQGFLGDIDISKHILKAKGDENVVSRVGYGLELFETIFLGGGFYEGAGFANTTTFGFGIRTKGIFRLFQTKYTKNAFSFILDTMDFQYYTSTYSVFPNDEVRFHGIMVSVKGI